MAWFLLFAAGVFEVGWAVALKYTSGFTVLVPSLLTALSMIASVGLLGIAVETLPIGTAYAIWTGIGIIGSTVLGMALFGEPSSPIRLTCIVIIVGGIIGLKLTS